MRIRAGDERIRFDACRKAWCMERRVTREMAQGIMDAVTGEWITVLGPDAFSTAWHASAFFKRAAGGMGISSPRDGAVPPRGIRPVAGGIGKNRFDLRSVGI